MVVVMEERATEAQIEQVVKRLVEMAPSEAWGDDFLYGIETYDAGLSTFAQYYATTEPPEFAGGQTAVSGGVASWPDDIVLVRLSRPVRALAYDRLLNVSGILEIGIDTDTATGFVSLVRLREAQYTKV